MEKIVYDYSTFILEQEEHLNKVCYWLPFGGVILCDSFMSQNYDGTEIISDDEFIFDGRNGRLDKISLELSWMNKGDLRKNIKNIKGIFNMIINKDFFNYKHSNTDELRVIYNALDYYIDKKNDILFAISRGRLIIDVCEYRIGENISLLIDNEIIGVKLYELKKHIIYKYDGKLDTIEMGVNQTELDLIERISWLISDHNKFSIFDNDDKIFELMSVINKRHTDSFGMNTIRFLNNLGGVSRYSENIMLDKFGFF